MLSSKSHPISCNFPSLISLQRTKNSRTSSLLHPRTPIHIPSTTLSWKPNPRANVSFTSPDHPIPRRGILQISGSSVDERDSELPTEAAEGIDAKASGDGKPANDWTTSALLFGLWAALIFYVFRLTPNQTPYRDSYFLQKLLSLTGDDGFEMNPVLVALWYIMGFWPLIYSTLLIPSGRSSKSKIPVWPFLVFSFFGGAYALIPYFVLWKPPTPAVGEDEIGRWPLKFLESKITAGALLAAGLGLGVYAGVADGDVWKEFYQYFRESKLVHVTCLDFMLLSAFAPFWVYNDMTARRWTDKGSWLLPVSLIPFVGPALYLLLRPPLSALPMSTSSTTSDAD